MLLKAISTVIINNIVLAILTLNYNISFGQKIITTKSPPFEMLTITSNPTGANIYIEDSVYNTPHTFYPKEYNLLDVIVRKKGYEDDTIKVHFGVHKNIHVELRPIVTKVLFKSKDENNIDSIMIYEITQNKIDTIFIGKTRCEEEFNYGSHTLLYMKKDYISEEDSIDVSKTETIIKDISLRKNEVDLSIISLPEGAKIYIDEKHTGNYSNSIEKVRIGIHLIKLTKKDFYNYYDSCLVKEGEDNVIEAYLRPSYFKVTIYDSKDKNNICGALVKFGDIEEKSSKQGEVIFMDPIFPSAIKVTKKEYQDFEYYYLVGMVENNIYLKKQPNIRINSVSIEYLSLINDNEYNEFIKTVKSVKDYEDYISIIFNTYKKDFLNKKIVMDIDITLYSRIGIGMKYKPKYTFYEGTNTLAYTNILLSGGVYGFGRDDINGNFVRTEIGVGVVFDKWIKPYIKASFIPFYRIPYRTIQDDVLEFKAMGWKLGGGTRLYGNYFIECNLENIYNEDKVRLRTLSFGFGYIF